MDDTESRPAAQRPSLKAKLQEELAANVELEVRMPDDTARAVIESMARGAVATPELLAAHPPHSAIGKALRLSRLKAATVLGNPKLVFGAIRNTPNGSDTIEQQVSAVRAVYHCARASTARGLRQWLSSRSAHYVLGDLLRESELVTAIRRGTPAEVQRILATGVSPHLLVNSAPPLPKAVTLLALAIENGSAKKTSILLAFGADATGVRRAAPYSERSRSTALHFVAESTRSPKLNRNDRVWREIVRLLVRHGVDINAVDEAGSTALHYMALHDCFNDRLRFLLGAGAHPDVAVAPGFWFAIDAAAWNSAGRNFTLLLGLQSDPARRAHKSAALLAKAAQQWGWETAIPRLLAAGVDVDAVNEDNKTCLDVTICQAEQHLPAPLQFPWDNKPTIDAWIAFGAKVRPAHFLKHPARSDARLSIGRTIRTPRVHFILEMDEPLTTLRYLQQNLPHAAELKERLDAISLAARYTSLHAGRMCHYWLAGYAARDLLNKRKNQRPSLFLVHAGQTPSATPSEDRDGGRSTSPDSTGAQTMPPVTMVPSQEYDLCAVLADLLQGSDNTPTSEDLELGLLQAVRSGSTDEVIALLGQGANPNRHADMAEDWSVLGIALMRGHSAIVTALLDHGASVHDVLHEPHAAEPRGANAFHALCGCGDAGRGLVHFSTPGFSIWRAMAELVAVHGADINAHSLRRWNGDTPLIAAISNGLSSEKCQFLIDAGADVNAHSTDREDRNAITAAINRKDIEALELLLDAGVPVDGFARQDGAPIHSIARNASPNQVWRTMLPALVDRGADVNALDIWFDHALTSVALDAHRQIRLITTQVAGLHRREKKWRVSAVVIGACETIHGWIAAGATPPVWLLRTYPNRTAIGKALRSSPLHSALLCDPPWFLQHVLKQACRSDAAFQQLINEAMEPRPSALNMNDHLLESWLAGAAARDRHPTQMPSPKYE